MEEGRIESIDRVAFTDRTTLTPCQCECHTWPELSIDLAWHTGHIERCRKDRRGRTLCSLNITDNCLSHQCRSCGGLRAVSTPKTEDPAIKCATPGCGYVAREDNVINGRRWCRECYFKEQRLANLADRGW